MFDDDTLTSEEIDELINSKELTKSIGPVSIPNFLVSDADVVPLDYDDYIEEGILINHKKEDDDYYTKNC